MPDRLAAGAKTRYRNGSLPMRRPSSSRSSVTQMGVFRYFGDGHRISVRFRRRWRASFRATTPRTRKVYEPHQWGSRPIFLGDFYAARGEDRREGQVSGERLDRQSRPAALGHDLMVFVRGRKHGCAADFGCRPPALGHRSWGGTATWPQTYRSGGRFEPSA